MKIIDKIDFLLDESRKSAFMGKLIGLGVMKKNKDGTFTKVKDIPREEVISQLTGMKKHK